MFKSIDLTVRNVAKRFLYISATGLKGHSKWQNIKNIKADNDRQRTQMIVKQLRMLRIAANEGGSPHPDRNSMLRGAIDEAKRRDVPKITIQNFLKKLSENKDKTIYQKHLFEGKLYKKLFFIITIYTDNVARSKIHIATPFRKHLVESANNTKRLFTERGIINAIARDDINVENFDDECLSDALECGAEDIEVGDIGEKQVTFLCDSNEFLKVRQKLTATGYQIEHSECAFFSNTNLAQLNDTELADYKKFKERLLLIDGFDDIYDNLENDDADL